MLASTKSCYDPQVEFLEIGYQDSERADTFWKFYGPATLFRGTSVGYQGSPALQKIGITPASTDPMIATLFATESANYGAGVVHIASPNALKGVSIGQGNVLAALEREVSVDLLPAQFAARSQTISVTQSRAILEGLGLKMPSTIVDKAALDFAIRVATPLTPAQIQFYIKAAGL